jgi:hypothetical protein
MTITIRIDRRFVLTICAFTILFLAFAFSTDSTSKVAAQDASCPPAKVIEPRIIPASYQLMENGWFVWLGDTRQLFVLTYDANSKNTGTVEVYQENWEQGMPEIDSAIVPPTKYMWQPKRGFGKLWRENPNVRARMGWGVKDSEGYMMVVTVDGDKMWFNGHDQAFKIVGNRWEMFWAWD